VSHPVVRLALGADLAALQALARRTIDASYRAFLGDEAVDRFITSGASDEHVETQLHRGHLHCMEAGGELVGLLILDGPTIDLMMIDVRRHRRGMGTVLLGHAEELLFARYEWARLESFADNEPANAFYAACGWRESRRLDSAAPAKIEFSKHRAATDG